MIKFKDCLKKFIILLRLKYVMSIKFKKSFNEVDIETQQII